MKSGTIIDIKRYTLHDGGGIRSTLFLKGCGLGCAWCQNPEGVSAEIGLWYIGRQCIRCRGCASACPRGALRIDEEEPPFVRIDRALCDRCGACVAACPTTALSFDGRRVTAEEAAETLLRDMEFYEESGGGVTVSGGDPLIQSDFALEVLRLCKAAGAHTAIETCLFGPWETLERFLPCTDLFIADLKLADDAMHREFTRRPNDLIKRNYAELARRGVELLTRIPLIPGITATEENVAALASFIREAKPGAEVELINFNPLAVGKYALMGRSTAFFEGMVPLPEDEVEALRALLEAEGLSAVREHRRSGAGGR